MNQTTQTTNNTMAVAERKPSGIVAIIPKSFQEVIQVANIYYKSGLKPKGCTRPEDVAAIILAGLEAGLRPGQALNCMYLVNGKAVIYGDMPLALVRASGLLQSIEERVEGHGEDRAGVCTMQRRGEDKARLQRYSLREARGAGLLMKGGKAGPWDHSTDRMLMLRARGWLLRDLFGDVLAGLGLAEEQEDIVNTTATVAATPPSSAPRQDEPPTDVHGEVMIDDAQLAEIVRLKQTWVNINGPSGGDPQAGHAEWLRMLAEKYGVDSAKKLSSAQADELIAVLRAVATSPTSALVPPPAEPAGAEKEATATPSQESASTATETATAA